MKRCIKNRILAVLLAAALAAGNVSPAVFAASDNMAVEKAESEKAESEKAESEMEEGGISEEAPETETGPLEETSPPEEETQKPEAGALEGILLPEEGTGGETAEPEDGALEQIPSPEAGSGEEITEPEDGTEEEVGVETPTPDKAGIMDELLNSGLLEEIPEQLPEDAEEEQDFPECTCGSNSNDFSEHEEECGYYQYLLESAGGIDGIAPFSIYDVTYKQNGYRLSDSSVKDWTLKSGSFSNQYRAVRFYPGISSMSLWVDSGANVKTWTRTIGNYKCMHPDDDSVNTKKHFGALYSKVVYDGQQWYDMKVTVLNYTNSAVSNDGTAVTIRPGITFAADRIAFQTSQKVGAVRIRVDFLKTGTNTSANLNIRFQWRDIDDSQRFGFALGDGTVDGKYYFDKNTVVNRSSNKEVLGMDMEVLIGPADHFTDETDTRTRIVYELGNCSKYYIAFGPEDNIGNTDRQIVYTTEFYRECEKALKSGKDEVVADKDGDGKKETTTTINDLLVVTDATSVIETPAPIKRVSNSFAVISPEGYVSWPTSNTLSSTTSEYYYMIRQEVPWQDTGCRYEIFSIKDSLPAGVDYVPVSNQGFVSIKGEDGNDKSSLFTFGASNDVITITAKNPSDGNFAGHWYTFIFKVKMDPTEITPTYSGNSAVYEISNTASVTSKNSGASQTVKNTNAVMTRASSIRPTQENPQKGINRNVSLTEYTAKSVSEEVVFSIFQKIPAYDVSWEPCTMVMTDTLENCLQYTGCTVNLDGAVLADGWTASVNGQTVTVTGLNKNNYSGKTLRFDITCRVKDGYDLSSYQHIEDGDMTAVIPNKAKVKFIWSHASVSAVEKETNTVHVKVKKNAVDLIVHKTSADTAEPVPGAEFTVYEWDGKAYSINRGIMTYDVSGKEYRMDRLVRTDTNAGKFKVEETSVPYGYTGSWEKEFTIEEAPGGGTKALVYNVTNKLQKGRIIIHKENEAGDRLKGAVFEITAEEDILSPQGMVLTKAGTVVESLTTNGDGIAASKDLYIGHYLINEVKAPAGYDISEEAFGAVFRYSHGLKEDKVTEMVINVTNPMKKVHLKLTKEIDTRDVVWAHGNPAFTFKVEGTDLCGNFHTYYETVEFTKDNIGNGEKAVLTAELMMPSGTYQAAEEKTMRYRLDHIHSISGGKPQGEDTVIFDLSQGNDGAAVFYNEKTTDENLSHTVFVRNVIQE